ncbi:MAG: thioredoxin domain-containing protein [Phycisphaeraceae bacterium]|nr:thioredoxin domain-containing protein [Phycisphaeraceae bacterium]
MSTTHAHTNRLAHETSPYLLQHAHNPVDWYAWSDEAFAKARAEDKPIFLSIGYSTCHWCHVMEHESFENTEIAAVLNEHFVCIKVDREQRPDVDATYMEAVTLLTGAGGWPLSAFLTPDGRPFYGGTYFPPEPRYGRPGFKQILTAIAEAWQSQRGQLLESADKITAHLDQASDSKEGTLDKGLLDRAFSTLVRIYDPTNAGFGGAPKFPQPTQLSFLLNHYYQTGETQALDMVTHTLDVMAKAGMYDHLGGGFHRYATDVKWLVPHFEKMLYDQALISRVYLDAYKITGKTEYSRIVSETLDYVLRDLRDPGGAFYAAEDADSEGHEGLFYVWTPAQIQQSLSDDQARVFMAYYGVTKSGNYEQGQSILNVTEAMDTVAKQLDLSVPQAEVWLKEAQAKLFDARVKRVRPHRDTKIITAWNGLFISSLARAGSALERPDYVLAAKTAAKELLARLEVDGRVMRSLAAGQVSGPGFLDDYAFLIAGCLDLYESTFETTWLEQANRLAGRMVTLFDDPANAGFYLAGNDVETLLTRGHKPEYDGAVPSGNSMAAVCLARLARLTGNVALTEKAESTFKFLASRMQASPIGLTTGACGLAFWILPGTEIVLASQLDDPNLRLMQQALHRAYLPNTVTLWHPSSPQALAIEALVPMVKSMKEVDGKATVYLCENFACKQPVTSPEQFSAMLETLSKARNKRP